MNPRSQKPELFSNFEFSVASEQIQDFFGAVEWSLDEKSIAPPTLATVFRQGEFEALSKLGIELHNVLHAEQEYRFNKHLLPEVSYKGQTFLNSHFEKTGNKGNMTFYVFQTNLVDESGETCVECLTTIVAKG